jgi:hypothetical protein
VKEGGTNMTTMTRVMQNQIHTGIDTIPAIDHGRDYGLVLHDLLLKQNEPSKVQRLLQVLLDRY